MNIDTAYLRRCIDMLESMSDALNRSSLEETVYDMYSNVCIEKFELVLEQSGKLLKKTPSSRGSPVTDRLIALPSGILSVTPPSMA